MFLLGLITVTSFLLSVAAKIVVDHSLDHRIPLIGSFVGLEHIENPGIAFGITFLPWLQTLFITIALCIVFWMAFHTLRKSNALRLTPYALAFGLILGGGLANVIDRLGDGLVTDFLQVGNFPIFNVADSCITVGVGLLLLEIFLKGKDSTKKNEK